MKKLVLIIALVGIFGSPIFAQTGNDVASSGSIYSKLGVGYPVSIANTAAQSMSLIGISYNNPFVGNLANPAFWGSNYYGLGAGSIYIRSFNANNGTNSVINTNFSVNQFQLQLPVVKGKVGISASFMPVTEGEFHTMTISTGQNTPDYSLVNRGNGGVNRAELGVGWEITPNISVGYAPSLVFMSHDNKVMAFFNDISYRPVNFTVETSGYGFGNRFGAALQFRNVLQEDDHLGIGATVNLPVKMNSEKKQTGTINNGAVNITSELPNGEGTIRLPMKISGGISYSPSDALMIGAEGLYQGWSGYQNELQPSEEELFVDRYKMGLGLQYFPYVTGSNKFLSYFKYRAGASYDTGHLRIEGKRINTLKFSFGLGIRSPRSNSSVDLSFEYGIRGTKSLDLAQEKIWGVRLSLNLAELMFFRPKLK